MADPFEGLDPMFSSNLQRLVAASGGRVWITSGFRSVERQQQLWNAAVAKYGSEAAARKWVAPPGRSHHNHGIAADLGFANAGARQWVHDNASRFGLYFPMEWEPWHIEPAGQAARGNRDAYTTPPGDLLNPTDQAQGGDPYDIGTQVGRLMSLVTSVDVGEAARGPDVAGAMASPTPATPIEGATGPVQTEEVKL